MKTNIKKLYEFLCGQYNPVKRDYNEKQTVNKNIRPTDDLVIKTPPPPQHKHLLCPVSDTLSF